MLRRVLLLIVIMMIVLPVSMAQDDLQDQKILLTFIPNIQFAPIYVGIEQGYFADSGFAISLEYLQEPDVVDLIAAGQEQFGVVSGEQVIISRSQAREVVYVYEWFQEYPVGVVVPADSGVETVQDLAGLKVGLPGRFGATYSALTTLLMGASLSEEDIQIDEIGFNAPEVMCLGAIESAVVYVNNEPLQIRNRAANGDCGEIADVTVIRVSEVADLVSNGLITSADMVDDNPEMVAAVIHAFDRALQDTINNPARAYLLSLNHVENMPASDDFVAMLEMIADEQDALLETNPSRDVIAAFREAIQGRLQAQFGGDELLQFEVLLATIELWDAEQLGFSDLASWEAMQDTLITLGLVDEGIALEEAFTNDFLLTD